MLPIRSASRVNGVAQIYNTIRIQNVNSYKIEILCTVCGLLLVHFFSLHFDIYFVERFVLVLRSRWSQNYLRPGAGAEIIFLLNIYCIQFGGC